MLAMTGQRVRIHMVQNKKTGLLVAMSDDLDGLMVAGRSVDDVKRQVPGAIRELIEAMGQTVVSVTEARPTDQIPSSFEDTRFEAEVTFACP